MRTRRGFRLWSEQVPSFAALLGEHEGAVAANRIAAAFCRSAGTDAQADRGVARALDQAKVRGGIAFQWVRGSVPLGLSAAVVAFARQRDIHFDLRRSMGAAEKVVSKPRKTSSLPSPWRSICGLPALLRRAPAKTWSLAFRPSDRAAGLVNEAQRQAFQLYRSRVRACLRAPLLPFSIASHSIN